MSPYRICQLVGWSLQGLMSMIIPTLFGGLRWVVVGRAVTGTVLGIALTDLFRAYFKKMRWLDLPPSRLMPRMVVGSLLVAGAIYLGVLPFLLAFIPAERAGPMAAVLAGHATVVLSWSGIYLTVHYLRRMRAAEVDKWKLELSRRDAELRALRAQLNPHFLFNSLNSLRGLVSEDPSRAQTAITWLAALLRFTLQSSPARTITLERELEATRHYLALETLRFEDRLQHVIEVDPPALDHPVPPMLLQTLVENAITHGIAPLPDGGTVRILARRRPHDLYIRVTNTGRLGAGNGSAGIGLANSLERLRLVFGPRARLELRASEPGEVICEAVVPTPVAGQTDAEEARFFP